MPPRKARTDRDGLGQEATSIGTQRAGRKVAPKQKLDDRAGDASMASKRGRKILVRPQTIGGFINPFALAAPSTHPSRQQTEPIAHLVPPESIPDQEQALTQKQLL